MGTFWSCSILDLRLFLGVSETESAATVSTIDVCINDMGSILNFRIGFSLRLSEQADFSIGLGGF